MTLMEIPEKLRLASGLIQNWRRQNWVLESSGSPPLSEQTWSLLASAGEGVPLRFWLLSKPIHLQAKAKLLQGEGCAPRLICAHNSSQLDPWRFEWSHLLCRGNHHGAMSTGIETALWESLVAGPSQQGCEEAESSLLWGWMPFSFPSLLAVFKLLVWKSS